MRSSVRMMALAGLFTGLALSLTALGDEVNITKDIPYVDVSHKGQTVRIQRIQDKENRLVDDFAKTSRPCPPFCIHPISAAPGVETLGELELIHFLMNEVQAGKGVLVDARMPEWYEAETIPGAINIPFVVFNKNNPYLEKILLAMGASHSPGGGWNFDNASTLTLFCNGPWCDQSPRAIQGLLEVGYPADKLKYYRDGMNLWRLLGLTTVASKKPVAP
ncbi:MAG: rhodanese-like domain-containing protein [Gammaproteobacteria bacterium]|nr:rhodanese-like domain-containing protein [Gammaproteobacteria bacterium]MBU1654376.1 rhodanese-like domain-containing protein [Gammaproteobacteria bacterium]MBU1962003.1 rhodanese-like domain-containing protein [Gammaproteobacteria bacterium]